MTDEELIARLRGGATWDDDIAAADRIEDLLKKNSNLLDLAADEHSRAERAIFFLQKIAKYDPQSVVATTAIQEWANQALRDCGMKFG